MFALGSRGKSGSMSKGRRSYKAKRSANRSTSAIRMTSSANVPTSTPAFPPEQAYKTNNTSSIHEVGAETSPMEGFVAAVTVGDQLDRKITSIARMLNAFTRAVPYALIEYILFLFLVQTAPIAAGVIGIALFLLALGTTIGVQHGSMVYLTEDQWKSIEQLLGYRLDILSSFMQVGAALMCWFYWNLTGTMLFSWLSLVILLSALCFMLLAQYRARPHSVSEGATSIP
jgi:hypothetical protein